MHIDVNSRQLTVKCTVRIHSELRDKFIAANYGKPPWLTKVFVRTVRKIDLHVVVSSGILADKFCYKHLWELMKQAVITLREASEEYMVKVGAKSDC